MFKQILADLSIIKERDPAARGAIELILGYPGFQALTIHRISNRSVFEITLKNDSKIAEPNWPCGGIEIHPAENRTWSFH